MEPPYLVAGLGNPGTEYQGTRHNAGFMLVERLAQKAKAAWRDERKLHCKLARAEIEGRKVLLCEPQTFMNLSGEALAAVSGFFKIPLPQVLVAVDDADLEVGVVRLRPEGSSGGHHGLESIEAHLESRQFARLRLGVGRSGPRERQITGHVLGRFRAAERKILDQVLERAVRQVECWLTLGVQRAMNEFNGAVTAPTEKDS